MVKGLPKNAWMPVFLTLSARTSAGAVQEQIEGRLDKRRRGVLGPPPGQTCLIFVDDLNMPAKETYGAQVTCLIFVDDFKMPGMETYGAL